MEWSVTNCKINETISGLEYSLFNVKSVGIANVCQNDQISLNFTEVGDEKRIEYQVFMFSGLDTEAQNYEISCDIAVCMKSVEGSQCDVVSENCENRVKMMELAAVLLLRCGGANADAESVKALLSKVEISADDAKLDALLGDCKDLDFEGETTKGKAQLDIFANIGGGSAVSGGSAAAAGGEAAAAAVVEEEEAEEESSAAAGGMFGGSGSEDDSSEDESDS